MGAGASACFQSNGVQCPTVSGFFTCASKLGLFERYRREGMMEPFFRFLRHEFGIIKKELGSTLVNIEDVMTRLDSSIEEYEEYGQYKVHGYKRRYQKGFNLLTTRFQAIVFIGHVLLEITNDKRCHLHDRLAACLSNEDVLISFNYDLLMDNALSSTGRWFPDSGYGIPFKNAIENGKFVQPDDKVSKITYFKLHGSLNWLHGQNPYSYMRIGTHIPFGQDVFLVRKINHEITAAPIDIAGKYEHTENGIYYDLHSLLIAPRADKPYGLFPNTFSRLWDKATTAVKQADELILIGYSIPESDARVKELIQVVGSDKGHLICTVVDKKPEPIVEKIESLVDFNQCRIYREFRQYLDSLE